MPDPADARERLQIELIRVWRRGLDAIDGSRRPKTEALGDLGQLEEMRLKSPWANDLRRDAVRSMFTVALGYLKDSSGERLHSSQLAALYGLGERWKKHTKHELWLAATESVPELSSSLNLARDVRRRREEVWRRNITTAFAEALLTASAHNFETVGLRVADVRLMDLPPRAPYLIGRKATLKRLRGTAVDEHLLIAGPPGVGKTALAVEVAHSLVEQYEDGVLFVDAMGYGEKPALSPDQILRSILQRLLVTSQTLPSEFEQLLASYRSTLAQMNILIVLDNVADPAVVLNAIPSGGVSRLIVTSRRALEPVRMRARMRVEELRALSPKHSLALLNKFSKLREVDQDALDALIETLEGLPLALAIVGARLAARRPGRIQSVVGELRANYDRVLEMEALGDNLTVAAAISWSVERLPDTTRKMLLFFSVMPISVFSEVMLRNGGGNTWERDLEALLDEHLVAETNFGGFHIEPIVRSFMLQSKLAGLTQEQLSVWRDHVADAIFASLDASPIVPKTWDQYSSTDRVLVPPGRVAATDVLAHHHIRSLSNLGFTMGGEPGAMILGKTARMDAKSGNYWQALKTLSSMRQIIKNAPPDEVPRCKDELISAANWVRSSISFYGARTGWSGKVGPILAAHEKAFPEAHNDQYSVKIAHDAIRRVPSVAEYLVLCAQLDSAPFTLWSAQDNARIVPELKGAYLWANFELVVLREDEDSEDAYAVLQKLFGVWTTVMETSGSPLVGWEAEPMFTALALRHIQHSAFDLAVEVLIWIERSYLSRGVLGHVLFIRALRRRLQLQQR